MEILIHCGYYATRLKLLPKIESCTLCSGWDEDKVQDFTKAIKQVVIENPILSSHLNWRKHEKSLYACPNTYTPENHSFVTVVDESDNTTINDLDSHESRLGFINNIADKLACEKNLVSDDIKTKRSLFHCHLFRFGNGYTCYHVGVSHALADAHTYYLIIDQISAFMNQKPVTKIVWGNPDLTTLETFPDHFTRQDKRRLGLLPLLLGFFRNSIFARGRKEQTWIFSKEKLNLQKTEQVDLNVAEYISSHDLIISAICRANQSSDEVSIHMDNRTRDPSFGPNDGGNCLKKFHMPSKVGSNPNLCRKAVNRGYYFEANEAESKATMMGRVCYTSNWSTGYKSIQGVSTLCHCPSMSFFRSMPTDLCLVYQIDENNIAVAHNIHKVNCVELGKMETWLKVLK